MHHQGNKRCRIEVAKGFFCKVCKPLCIVRIITGDPQIFCSSHKYEEPSGLVRSSPDWYGLCQRRHNWLYLHKRRVNAGEHRIDLDLISFPKSRQERSASRSFTSLRSQLRVRWRVGPSPDYRGQWVW
jgi:hypothetical protein